MAIPISVPEAPPEFDLTDRDREILLQSDEEYHLLTWEEIKTIIGNNELDKLTRLPSQLRAYIAWSAETKKRYGTLTRFLICERLFWTPIPCSKDTLKPRFSDNTCVPFTNKSDYKILLNDWPYGLEHGITHLCVWLKCRLPVVPDTGELTKEGAALVDRFVEKAFVERLGLEGQNKVLWFKNRSGLQSVKELEHVHVLIKDVDASLIDSILDKS